MRSIKNSCSLIASIFVSILITKSICILLERWITLDFVMQALLYSLFLAMFLMVLESKCKLHPIKEVLPIIIIFIISFITYLWLEWDNHLFLTEPIYGQDDFVLRNRYSIIGMLIILVAFALHYILHRIVKNTSSIVLLVFMLIIALGTEGTYLKREELTKKEYEVQRQLLTDYCDLLSVYKEYTNNAEQSNIIFSKIEIITKSIQLVCPVLNVAGINEDIKLMEKPNWSEIRQIAVEKQYESIVGTIDAFSRYDEETWGHVRGAAIAQVHFPIEEFIEQKSMTSYLGLYTVNHIPTLGAECVEEAYRTVGREYCLRLYIRD